MEINEQNYGKVLATSWERNNSENVEKERKKS